MSDTPNADIFATRLNRAEGAQDALDGDIETLEAQWSESRPSKGWRDLVEKLRGWMRKILLSILGLIILLLVVFFWNEARQNQKVAALDNNPSQQIAPNWQEQWNEALQTALAAKSAEDSAQFQTQLNQKLLPLEQRLQNLETQVQDLKDSPNNSSQAASAASNSELTILHQAVAQLRQDLTQLQNQLQDLRKRPQSLARAPSEVTNSTPQHNQAVNLNPLLALALEEGLSQSQLQGQFTPLLLRLETLNPLTSLPGWEGLMRQIQQIPQRPPAQWQGLIQDLTTQQQPKTSTAENPWWQQLQGLIQITQVTEPSLLTQAKNLQRDDGSIHQVQAFFNNLQNQAPLVAEKHQAWLSARQKPSLSADILRATEDLISELRGHD